jgi:hypothetical protein
VTGKRYLIYGLVLQSDFPLPELLECTDSTSETQITIITEKESASSGDGMKWFLSWTTPSGNPWFSCAKDADSYLLRYEGAADFRVDKNGTEIHCRAHSQVAEDTIRHLLLNQAIPMVLNLRGQEALHASAVATPEGAVAFCGASGAGKSTLAAIFQQGGSPLMTDDCLAISEVDGAICAAAGYPGLRLWKNVVHDLNWDHHAHHNVAHYTSKRRVDIQRGPEDYCASPQVLKAIYVLAADSEDSREGRVKIETLTATEQLIALLSYCFRLDINDGAMLARQFLFFARIPELVRIRRIYLPRNPQRLSNTRQALLADLASGSPTASSLSLI